jgi:hypothetical protein
MGLADLARVFHKNSTAALPVKGEGSEQGGMDALTDAAIEQQVRAQGSGRAVVLSYTAVSNAS